MRLGALTATALASGTARPIILAALEFDSGTVRLHNDLGLITVLSEDWTGLGSYAGVGQVSETDSLSPAGITLQVSSLTPELIDPAFNEEYQLRPARIYLGARDNQTQQFVEDPTLAFKGTMEQMAGTMGSPQGDVLGIQCESDLARLDRASGRLLSEASHQSRHPLSRWYEFQVQIEDANVVWRGQGGTPIRGRVGTAYNAIGTPIA